MKKTAKKILIIDDEKELIDTLKGYLGARGYEVISANNGREGLEKMKDAPNMVFLDIMMPGMDGFEVLRRMRNSMFDKYTPIIMLTAKSESSSIFKAQGLQVTDYVIKPFQLERLLEIVNKYI